MNKLQLLEKVINCVDLVELQALQAACKTELQMELLGKTPSANIFKAAMSFIQKLAKDKDWSKRRYAAVFRGKLTNKQILTNTYLAVRYNEDLPFDESEKPEMDIDLDRVFDDAVPVEEYSISAARLAYYAKCKTEYIKIGARIFDANSLLTCSKLAGGDFTLGYKDVNPHTTVRFYTNICDGVICPVRNAENFIEYGMDK